MGYWRFPNIIEYIVLACCPPRSDASHDGGLVDLLETQKLNVLLFSFTWLKGYMLLDFMLIVTTWIFGMKYNKETLLKRQRTQILWCMCFIPFGVWRWSLPYFGLL